jgi:hypothetical protein
MGMKAIEIPSFFNKEWYEEQKKLGKTDVKMASEFYISIPTFKRWKKVCGIETTYETRLKSSLRPLLGDEESQKQLKDMYLAGASYNDMARIMQVSKETVRKELRKMGLKRERSTQWQVFNAR